MQDYVHMFLSAPPKLPVPTVEVRFRLRDGPGLFYRVVQVARQLMVIRIRSNLLNGHEPLTLRQIPPHSD